VQRHEKGEDAMNWDQIQGQWLEIKGRVRSRWAKLTDHDLLYLSGKKEELVGLIQQRYGIMKADAERQVDEWVARLKASGEKQAPAGKRQHQASKEQHQH
jgi:uncharacterized protein YjbJ (UPF0337 family)